MPGSLKCFYVRNLSLVLQGFDAGVRGVDTYKMPLFSSENIYFSDEKSLAGGAGSAEIVSGTVKFN